MDRGLLDANTTLKSHIRIMRREPTIKNDMRSNKLVEWRKWLDENEGNETTLSDYVRNV